MSKFMVLQDSFGNDMHFGDCGGDMRFAALDGVEDYSVQLQKIRDLDLQPDDVIVSGYPRSGNNWTHHMVTLLRTGNLDVPKTPTVNSKEFVFLDYVGGDLGVPKSDKPRSLISHVPFRLLPRAIREKKIKLVYVTRNPKDVFVSTFCHLNNTVPPFGYAGTWSQFFPFMLEHGYWYGDMFEHLKHWEKEIESHPEHPIYHLSYEKAKRDTLGEVERLNEFLGTNRSRQFCQELVNTVQMSNMPVTRRFSPTFDGLFKENDSKKFYRKGMVGDWKNWFTVAQNEQFDEVYATKMADYKGSFVCE